MRRKCIHKNNDNNKEINNIGTIEDENIWVRERVTTAQKSVTNHKHSFHSISLQLVQKNCLQQMSFSAPLGRHGFLLSLLLLYWHYRRLDDLSLGSQLHLCYAQYKQRGQLYDLWPSRRNQM